jgi:hypothetical protein
VLEFDRPTRSKEHPTMKPVLLFDYLIRNNTKAMDLVLDPFLGSGTTIIASPSGCDLPGCRGYRKSLLCSPGDPGGRRESDCSPFRMVR